MALTDPSRGNNSPPPIALAGREMGRAVVWLSGEHDVATAPELGGILAEAIAADTGDLLVDLAQVQFMDASTFGVLLRSRHALRLQSRSLTVRAPSTQAARILTICGLEGLLDPHAAVVPPAPRQPMDCDELSAARTRHAVARDVR